MPRMRKLALLLVAFSLFLVAGCNDNVETGAGDGGPNPGSSPSPGDDDDDDDDGASTPPPYDPGEVPTSIGGFAAFGRFVDVNSNDFVGMVNLFPVPAPVPPALGDAWNDFPNHPIDTSERVYPSSVSVASNILPPDPGQLTLEGPNGDLTLTSIMGASYLSIWNDVNKFVPLTTYTFRATGNQVEPFAEPLLSPGEITSLTPNPVGPNPFPILRSQPFTLTWTSIPDGRPIYLYMTQKDTPEMTEWTWMCKMTDDGEFTVPTSMLQDFGATVPPFVTEEWRDKLQLRRANYGSFEPMGAVGPILTAFESGWYANIEFQ